ncbi:MAG: hypothetical protein AAF990_01995 [Bacteroidota bacterium]
MSRAITCLVIASLYIFPTDIQLAFEEAVQLLEARKAVVQKVADEQQVDWKPALAIVAPELIRYHLLKDFFETKALEWGYVNGGSKIADFSIGHFQMKPSFIEQLEAALACDEKLGRRWQMLLIDAKQDEKIQRQQRIERLKDFHWQLRYAMAFCELADEMYQCRSFSSVAERLRFYAAAYNFGFDQSPHQIAAWQQKAAFPYGQKFQGEQCRYSDLATAFYQQFQCSPF